MQLSMHMLLIAWVLNVLFAQERDWTPYICIISCYQMAIFFSLMSMGKSGSGVVAVANFTTQYALTSSTQLQLHTHSIAILLVATQASFFSKLVANFFSSG